MPNLHDITAGVEAEFARLGVFVKNIDAKIKDGLGDDLGKEVLKAWIAVGEFGRIMLNIKHLTDMAQAQFEREVGGLASAAAHVPDDVLAAEAARTGAAPLIVAPEHEAVPDAKPNDVPESKPEPEPEPDDPAAAMRPDGPAGQRLPDGTPIINAAEIAHASQPSGDVARIQAANEAALAALRANAGLVDAAPVASPTASVVGPELLGDVAVAAADVPAAGVPAANAPIEAVPPQRRKGRK